MNQIAHQSREAFRQQMLRRGRAVTTAPTYSDLFKKLQPTSWWVVGMPYQFDAQGQPIQGVNYPQWNNNYLPPLDVGEQVNLKAQLTAELQQNNFAALHDQTPAGAAYDNGQNGPILTILPVNTHATTGDLNVSKIANSIVKCLTAYRLYRGFKRTKSGLDTYDEADMEYLQKLIYIKDILLGEEPNANVGVDQVVNKLDQIADTIYNGIKQEAMKKMEYSLNNLCRDVRFTITKAEIYNKVPEARNWTDSLSQELAKLGQNTDYRATDLASVLTDSIKLLSLRRKPLKATEIESIDHSIKLVGGILSLLRGVTQDRVYTGDAAEEAEIKGDLKLSVSLFSKVVYTSIATSLNTILNRAIDEYQYKYENISPTNAHATLKFYKGLITPADVTASELVKVNEQLERYGERPIENSVLSTLRDNKEIVRNVLNN